MKYYGYNARQPWTDDDELRLLRMIEEGKTPAEVAKWLGRTETGVKKKLRDGVMGLEAWKEDNKPQLRVIEV